MIRFKILPNSATSIYDEKEKTTYMMPSIEAANRLLDILIGMENELVELRKLKADKLKADKLKADKLKEEKDNAKR